MGTTTTINGGTAWGDFDKKTKVYMTKMDLKGYNIPLTLVDNTKMTVNGKELEYGLPSYTDEKGMLYFWLPELSGGAEVKVDLTIKDEDGNVIPMDSFFIKDETHGVTLKQYVKFDLIEITAENRIRKRYDGLALDNTEINKIVNELLAVGIPVSIPQGETLKDFSKITIKSEFLTEPDTDNMSDVGRYELIITSTEFSERANFKDSFWGHRAYYNYAEIVQADTETILSIEKPKTKTKIFKPGDKIKLNSTVKPAEGEGENCASPKCSVQFYINGKKYGDPVELTAHDKRNEKYNYSTASIEWTPNNIFTAKQNITVEYIGDDNNYTNGSKDEQELSLDLINLDIDGDGNPDPDTDSDLNDTDTSKDNNIDNIVQTGDKNKIMMNILLMLISLCYLIREPIKKCLKSR